MERQTTHSPRPCSFKLPTRDNNQLWTTQQGWHAENLIPDNWTIEVPVKLSLDVLSKSANAMNVMSIEAGWALDASTRELQNQVEMILEGGAGFCLLRGLRLLGDVAVDERTVLFFSQLFGCPVSQTKKGNFIAKVQDLSLDLEKTSVRGHQTSAKLAFHTDRADRTLLVCVRQSRTGGLSRIVSSKALANVICSEAPDLAQRLYSPLPQDQRGEELIGESPFISIPIFSEENGIFVARYIRRFIRDSQRHPTAPRLTAKDIEALNMLDALADREGMALEILLEPGDVLILNNNVVFHGRTAFDDCLDREQGRLLLRVWLSHVSSRPLPISFADLYGTNVAGAYRGGVWPNEVV